MRTGLIASLAGALMTLTGCGFLVGLLQPGTTSVRLVNDGDFDVSVAMFFDDEQNVPREALTEFGTRMDFTIQPGASEVFSRECDALQAIVIDDADLMLIGEVGPETDTDVLRDGDDFGCGDTIVVTFDHSPLIVDFAATVSVATN